MIFYRKTSVDRASAGGVVSRPHGRILNLSDEELILELKQAQKEAEDLANELKSVNDRYGHLVGDFMLQ